MKYLILFSLLLISTQLIAEEKKGDVRKKITYDDIDEMTKKAKGFTRTSDYVHTWVKFPVAQGQSLSGGTKLMATRKGYITVVIFLASWNVKSQELISKFKDLEKKFQGLDVETIYIYTHDTLPDAQAFSLEYGLGTGMLAGHEINFEFHNPKIPSIYISDRHGWLANRFIDLDADKIKAVDAYLEKITVL